MGIAFKAVASSNVLNVLPVVGNTSLAGNIRGILGNFDEDPNNDLQSPTEEILQPNSTAEKIYDEFGILWRIAENDSLFTYEAGKSYSDYQKLSFRPTFVTPTNLPSEVKELCGGDEECVFDYAVTGSAELAAETQQFTVIFNTSVGASYQIKNCDDLPTINGGVWNASSTIEGSIATFSCYPGYEIEGESNNITCRNGSWSDFGNFTCILIITGSTIDSTTISITTVPISTDSMAKSFTTNVEETTIKPTDTERTDIISTEGTTTTPTTPETTSSEEFATYSSNEEYTPSTMAEIPSTDESTAAKSSVAYTVPITAEITTESDISITSTSQSTTRGATAEISSMSETTTAGPSSTIFSSTEDLVTTVKTTEMLPEGLTSTTASLTTTESLTTFKSTTDQSTSLQPTVSESIPTEYSTQRESTTEELDNATKSPTQRAIQQIDDFIKENYIYFIIGCVFVVICSISFGVLIYRRCVK